MISYQPTPVSVPASTSSVASSSSGVSALEMHSALEQQSSEMKDSTAAATSQMLGPVMETMRNLAQAQQQMQSWMAQHQAQQQALVAMNMQNLAAQAPVAPQTQRSIPHFAMSVGDSEDWEVESLRHSNDALWTPFSTEGIIS